MNPHDAKQGHTHWVCTEDPSHRWSNPLPVLTAQCQVCYADTKGNHPAMEPDPTKGQK